MRETAGEATSGTMNGIGWVPRAEPLPPVAVLGIGAAATALARRSLDRPDERLAKLSGCAAAGVLVLSGPEEELPWADGVVYLGREDGTTGLLMPTRLAPSVPVPLLERALRRRFPLAAPPFVLVPEHSLVIPVGCAQTVDRQMLAGWLRESR